jgi:hypothetical protein
LQFGHHFIPKYVYEILQIAISEVMVLNEKVKLISNITFDIKPQAIGIGPGMGRKIKGKKHYINSLK